MSLSRQFLRAPRLLSQCQRLGLVSQQRCQQSTSNELVFTFISPSDVFYKDQVIKQVDVPTMDSTFGILKDHVPTIAVLRPGLVTVMENEDTKKYFVSSGSVTVNSDSTVQILAEEAHPLDRFDLQTVTKALDAARSSQSSASSEEDKAEAQIKVECLEALSKCL